MTIGSALKQLRTKLGLTQAEMAAGIISVSFYSKVERDIHDIGTTELIELLNQHNIDVTTFFTTYISPKSKPDTDILEQINTAYERGDKKELLKIQTKLNALPKDHVTEYYRLQLRLYLDVYLPRAKKIPLDLKMKLKEYVFRNDNWDVYSLQTFRETMRIYHLDELSFLVNAILVKYPDPNKLTTILAENVGAICVNYLDNCYEYNAPELISRPLNYLQRLPYHKEILLVKILGNYYQAVFAKERAKCAQILQVLKDAGCHDLINVLPRL